MVIPAPSEGSEAVAVTSSASTGGGPAEVGTVGVTAAMPIPSAPMPIPNNTKLSSSAPGDSTFNGFDLLTTVTGSSPSPLNSIIKGISSSPPEKGGTANNNSSESNQNTPSLTLGLGLVSTLTMDLDSSDKVMVNSARGRRNRRSDPDLPPHLSEYSERNVIAILNRCDPERGRRCYSCGYDNTDKWLSNNQNSFGAYKNYGQRNSIGIDDEPYSWTFQHQINQSQQMQAGNEGGGSSGFHFQQTQPAPTPCWNYNYYESDSGYNTGYYYHQQQQPEMNMSESVEGRKRFYSDEGSGSNTISDDLTNAMDDEEVFTFDVSLS